MSAAKSISSATRAWFINWTCAARRSSKPPLKIPPQKLRHDGEPLLVIKPRPAVDPDNQRRLGLGARNVEIQFQRAIADPCVLDIANDRPVIRFERLPRGGQQQDENQ